MNIGHFLGLGLYQQKIALVWDLGRGTLRGMLGNEKLILDHDIQNWLIFDLVNVSLVAMGK